MVELTMRPTGWVQDVTRSKRSGNFQVDIEPHEDCDVLVVALVHGKQARAVTLLVADDADLSGADFFKRHMLPAMAQLRKA